MDIREKILRLEEKMRNREIADDGYYISRQYHEDCWKLYELRKRLAERRGSA